MSAIPLAFTVMGTIYKLTWVAVLTAGAHLLPAVAPFWAVKSPAIANAYLVAPLPTHSQAPAFLSRSYPPQVNAAPGSALDNYQPPDVGGPTMSGGSGTR